MTRKTVTLISISILVVGLITGGIIGCTPKEVTEEGPMTLPATAEAIQEGKIDVGKEYGLTPDQRYHKIHASVIGLECATCHISELDTTQTVFIDQDVSLQAPGPVDKRACLGCHRAGPGEDLYDLGSP